MNLHTCTAARRVMAAAAVTCAAAAAVTCAAAAIPAVALASPGTHADVASAARRASCTSISGNFYHVTKGGVSYYLGTPNNLSAGAAALLKPKENGTTEWTLCTFADSTVALLENRGLALTSRDSSPGGDVTLTPPGNGGSGFASQRWTVSAAGPMFTFANVKTGRYLRVRNTAPSMGQTVTTGSSYTVWFAF
jgi:hypothetical protein